MTKVLRQYTPDDDQTIVRSVNGFSGAMNYRGKFKVMERFGSPVEMWHMPSVSLFNNSAMTTGYIVQFLDVGVQLKKFDGTVLAENYSFTISENVQHTFRWVVSTGGLHTIYIDTIQRLSVVDTTYTTGGVGLLGFNCDVEWDDFVGPVDEDFEDFTEGESWLAETQHFPWHVESTGAGSVTIVQYGYEINQSGTPNLAFAGNNATLRRGRTIKTQPASLAVSERSAILQKQYSLTLETGALDITGVDAQFIKGKALTAGTGSLDIGLGSAWIGRGYSMSALVGALEISGVDASLLKGNTVVAEPVNLAITGGTANLVHSTGRSHADIAYAFQKLHNRVQADIRKNLVTYIPPTPPKITPQNAAKQAEKARLKAMQRKLQAHLDALEELDDFDEVGEVLPPLPAMGALTEALASDQNMLYAVPAIDPQEEQLVEMILLSL